jgi:hypothetical protein
LTDSKYAQYPGNIIFKLNGATIYSARVDTSPTTITFLYTPTGNGSGSLSATVTDSVLYSGTATTTLNYTVPTPTDQSTAGNP